MTPETLTPDDAQAQLLHDAVAELEDGEQFKTQETAALPVHLFGARAGDTGEQALDAMFRALIHCPMRLQDHVPRCKPHHRGTKLSASEYDQ